MKNSTPYAEPVRLLRVKEVLKLTGLSRSYLYALSADGRFPRSISLVPGGHARAWVEAEVSEWMEQRIAERDEGGAQ